MAKGNLGDACRRHGQVAGGIARCEDISFLATTFHSEQLFNKLSSVSLLVFAHLQLYVLRAKWSDFAKRFPGDYVRDAVTDRGRVGVGFREN